MERSSLSLCSVFPPSCSHHDYWSYWTDKIVRGKAMPWMLHSGGAQIFCPSVLCSAFNLLFYLHDLWTPCLRLFTSQCEERRFCCTTYPFRNSCCHHSYMEDGLGYRISLTPGPWYTEQMLSEHIEEEDEPFYDSSFLLAPWRWLLHCNFADLFKRQSRCLFNAFVTFRNWGSFLLAIYRMGSFPTLDSMRSV